MNMTTSSRSSWPARVEFFLGLFPTCMAAPRAWRWRLGWDWYGDGPGCAYSYVFVRLGFLLHALWLETGN